jgi:hypothetical protein
MRNNRTSALLRGTAKRTPEYIQKKNGTAVIALDNGNLQVLLYRKLATWQVCSTFWLDVHPIIEILVWQKKIKSFVFDYSLKKYPEAKVFELQQA